jgi:hypothetical protein
MESQDDSSQNPQNAKLRNAFSNYTVVTSGGHVKVGACKILGSISDIGNSRGRSQGDSRENPRNTKLRNAFSN